MTVATLNPKMNEIMHANNVDAIEKVAQQCNLAALVDVSRFQRAVILATGVKTLRRLLTGPMMDEIMALQNTSLGFRTDKKEGYDAETVRECVIEATIRGVDVVGNQFNIIAGRCYVTKEGFTRLLHEYPGLTDLRKNFAVPTMRDGGAIVKCDATWNLDGRPNSMDAEIPVKVNAGMGADAVLGKADRKLMARIWNMLTGSVMSTDDGDAGEAAPRRERSTTTGVASVAARLGVGETAAQPVDADTDVPI